MTTYIYLPPSGGSGSLYWEDPVLNAGALPGSDNSGAVRLTLDDGSLYWYDGASWELIVSPTADVQGPGSSTDNAVTRFDGATGKIIQNSNATLSDAGLLTLALALPVVSGGTNSSAALNNNRVMQSAGGAVVEASAITASRALISDANGIPTHSAVTSTELGYVSGVTSAIQTQLGTKVTGPGSATDEAVVRYDSTTGKLVQDSGVTIDDSANLATTARINAGAAKVGATGAVTASATLEVAGTTGAFLLPRLTDTQRDALTPAGGMLIYNTTNDRPQVYVAGSTNAWVDMIGWGE